MVAGEEAQQTEEPDSTQAVEPGEKFIKRFPVLRFSWRKGQAWYCQSVTPPLNVSLRETKPKKTVPYQAKDLELMLGTSVIDGDNLSFAGIKQKVEDYINPVFKARFGDSVYQVPPSTVSKLKKQLKDTFYGNPERNIWHIRTLAAKLQEYGHVSQVHFIGINKMKEIFLAKEEAEFRFRVKEREKAQANTAAEKRTWELDGLPEAIDSWNATLLKKNLTEGSAEKMFLSHFLFAPSVGLEALDNLELLLVADAAHASYGTLFSAYALSANANAVLLAHGFSCDNECNESWSQFFEFLKNTYPALDVNWTTMISDQSKGLQAAFLQVFENALPFYCMDHRAENVLKKAKTEGKDLYKRCALAKNEAQLQVAKAAVENAEQLTTSQKDYILKLDGLSDSSQFLYSRAAQQEEDTRGGGGGKLFGRTTSQTVESMNNANKAYRFSPDIFSGVLIMLSQLRRRYVEHQMSAQDRRHPLTPFAAKLFEDTKEELKHVTVRTLIGQADGLVYDVLNKNEFNCCLTSMSCQCGYPVTHNFICRHLMKLARYVGEDPLELATAHFSHYSSARWQEQYPLGTVVNIPSKAEITDVGTGDENLLVPLCRRIQPGRPKKKRKLSALRNETPRRAIRCSVCGRPGHKKGSKLCSFYNETRVT